MSMSIDQVARDMRDAVMKGDGTLVLRATAGLDYVLSKLLARVDNLERCPASPFAALYQGTPTLRVVDKGADEPSAPDAVGHASFTSRN